MSSQTPSASIDSPKIITSVLSGVLRKDRDYFLRKKPQVVDLWLFICGKTGIRTLGSRKGTTVFETAPIDHSGIFP